VNYLSLFVVLSLYSTFALTAESLTLKKLVQQVTVIEDTIENLNSFNHPDCQGSTDTVEKWKWKRRGKDRRRTKVRENIIKWNVIEEEAIAFNSEKLTLTVVSEKHLDYLFNLLKNMKDIPFGYPEDGCYARAHEMVKYLDDLGIKSAKSFVEGNLKVLTDKSPKGYVAWSYHVAPTVLVYKNGEYIPYVLDPSLFDHAVPTKEWIKIQTSHSWGNVRRAYIASKYTIDKTDASKKLEDYDWFDNILISIVTSRLMDEQNKRDGVVKPRKRRKGHHSK
jgi:hypothetical protein